MKPSLICFLICALLAGCNGGVDAPASAKDTATSRDASRVLLAGEDSEGGGRFDAGEPVDDQIDTSSESAEGGSVSDTDRQTDAGVALGNFDGPEDATMNDDSVHQDSLPEDAPFWPWANNDADAENNDAGPAEAGDASRSSDSSPQADQGLTPDGDAAVPAIDSPPPDVTWCGNQTFTTTTTIESGKTVAICAGAVLTFGPSVSLVVLGTLLAQGTANMPVRLIGQQGDAGAWGGVTAYAGGAVVLSNTEIHDATMAFSTAVSATYWLDHVVLGNSRQLLHLMSSGTIEHATMHALGEVQSTIGDAIVIDDSSPRIADSTVDNGSTGADLVQVNGTGSAPTFERMDVSHSHCGFHFNTSTNATIKDSAVHDCTYGLMVVYGMKSLLTGNNFERNTYALGLCLGGTATFRGNYVDATFADGTCSAMLNDAPATWPLPLAGPGP
jgi:hypothetical protein